ncbi:MAG: hypothetical protein QOH69_1508, partial [Actinomycetota bacterium]|nr:hypothetical protein [Actinomycetota bacterium]
MRTIVETPGTLNPLPWKPELRDPNSRAPLKDTQCRPLPPFLAPKNGSGAPSA